MGPILKVGRQIEVSAKGIEHPLTMIEVLGIGRPYKLFLPQMADAAVALTKAIPLTYEVVDAYYLGGEILKGSLTKLSPKGGEVRLETVVPVLSNLKMHLLDEKGREIPGSLYGKITGLVPKTSTDFLLRFTSVSPEVETLLRGVLASRASADVGRPAGTKRKRRRRSAPGEVRPLH